MNQSKYSMYSMWTSPCIPCEPVHVFYVEPLLRDHSPYGMRLDSIWNGPRVHMELTIPYGIYGLYGMRKWLESQLNVIAYGLHGMVHGVHGVQVHSIWINLGTVKTSYFFTFF